jgi:hypothetical protein
MFIHAKGIWSFGLLRLKNSLAKEMKTKNEKESRDNGAAITTSRSAFEELVFKGDYSINV